jgi:hypothetical protein
MKLAALVAILVTACGGPTTKPPEPITNAGDPTPVPAGPPGITGTIRDDVGQPLIGATIVLVDPSGTLLVGEQVSLTNEDGAYRFDNIPEGRYELTIYYSDLSFRRPFTVAGPTTVNQAVRAGSSGEVLICSGEAATSCR